jgi:hypothetical protein
MRPYGWITNTIKLKFAFWQISTATFRASGTYHSRKARISLSRSENITFAKGKNITAKRT